VAATSIDRLLKKLKALRSEHGLTQEEFAERAGLSYKYYQLVETGRKRELRLSTVDRLAAAYGMEGWQLLQPDVKHAKGVAAAGKGCHDKSKSRPN